MVSVDPEPQLQEGVDYEIDYGSYFDAGPAKVVITGKGDYLGKILELDYQILKLDLTNAKVTLSETSFQYNGQVQTPYIAEVKLDGKTLVGTYEVKYENESSTELGTYRVWAIGSEGNKNYTGESGPATYDIVKGKSLISLSDQTVTYTGQAIAYSGEVERHGSTGAVTLSYYSDDACTQAADPADVVNAGDYYVKATLAADDYYEGATSAAAKFTIAPAQIAVPTAKAGLVYNGAAQTGVEAGEHCTVTGGSATNAGSYTATATADVNYAFEGGAAKVSVPWSIARAQIAVPTAKTGLIYNGEEQTGVEAGEHCTVTGGSATEAGSYTATATADANHVFSTGAATASVKWAIAQARIAVPTAKTGLVYNGEEQTGVEAGAGYKVAGGSATDAGSYTATATADANHVFATGAATASVKWSIAKKANTLKAKAVKKTQKATYNKKVTIKAKKAFKVTKNVSKGKVTYKLTKVPKKVKKKITVSKTGNITIKKGTPKGTYKITVTLTSKAMKNYKAASKKVSFNIKVA